MNPLPATPRARPKLLTTLRDPRKSKSVHYTVSSAFPGSVKRDQKMAWPCRASKSFVKSIPQYNLTLRHVSAHLPSALRRCCLSLFEAIGLSDWPLIKESGGFAARFTNIDPTTKATFHQIKQPSALSLRSPGSSGFTSYLFVASAPQKQAFSRGLRERVAASAP